MFAPDANLFASGTDAEDDHLSDRLRNKHMRHDLHSGNPILFVSYDRFSPSHLKYTLRGLRTIHPNNQSKNNPGNKGTNPASLAQTGSARVQPASTGVSYAEPKSHHSTHSSPVHPGSTSRLESFAIQHLVISKRASLSPFASQLLRFSSLAVEHSGNRLSS